MHQDQPPSNLSHSKLWKFNQTRAAIFVELTLLALAGFIAWSFWSIWCPEGVEVCLGQGGIAPAHYLFLALLRPFVLTPHAFGTYLAARSFSEFDAIVLSAIASTLSAIPVYFLCYLVGKNLAVPWMSHNLPRTLRLIHSQDYKFIFATRLIPIFPFDIISCLAGVFNLNLKRFLIFTFLGILPECIFLTLMSSPKVSFLGMTINALGLIAGLVLAPFFVMEWQSRKKGKSLIATFRAAYKEILEEARMTNQIVKRHSLDPKKTPVLLLYGFFSSRRALHLLEKQLVAAGFDVLSFNLGGMFGTFFTHGVAETAEFIDFKIKRQMERHGFNKIHVVAHSKGTLVAYWWLLKLGGSKYCDKAIMMASPCAGSYYTYLAIVTPLAFFWRDMWQMRPGSSFLKLLQDSEIPNNLKIWSLYSEADRLARGSLGVFRPKTGKENITVLPMHEYSHFDFILKRGPIREVVKILTDDPSERDQLIDNEGTSLSQIIGENEDIA
ncbi:MAG: VTT domain-containing protein [Proteobacteria bacterium]|nr:VTT domain-containing protein [Pseudomonadota bacterium]